MNLYRVQILAPVFQSVGAMFREHGDVFLALLIYIGLPVIAWFLGRRSGRKKVKRGHTFILVVRPPTQPPPIPMQWNFDAPDDDSGPFGN